MLNNYKDSNFLYIYSDSYSIITCYLFSWLAKMELNHYQKLSYLIHKILNRLDMSAWFWHCIWWNQTKLSDSEFFHRNPITSQTFSLFFFLVLPFCWVLKNASILLYYDRIQLTRDNILIVFYDKLLHSIKKERKSIQRTIIVAYSTSMPSFMKLGNFII